MVDRTKEKNGPCESATEDWRERAERGAPKNQLNDFCRDCVFFNL